MNSSLPKEVTIEVWRGSPGRQYWERFTLREIIEGENIISALMRIRKDPRNAKGEKVAPIVWEDGCLEEVCGSCSMLINAKPRQACTALISSLIKESPVIRLAPLSKFPLVRDLVVDRSMMFENLKKVQAWVEVDDLRDPGVMEKISKRRGEVRYQLSTCMTCGCCSESCPQVNAQSDFIGPAPIAQAHLFNLHPVGKSAEKERLEELTKEGGIHRCSNAQNCVKVCPKGIPLTQAIGALSKDVTSFSFKKVFGHFFD